jgi:hypothetical protein
MSDLPPETVAPVPPEVDHPGLALALQQIGDLDSRPLAEHHDRLAAVHEVLHDVLHPDPDSR